MAARLIVTGDDFGASAGVNAAIVRAHREGILTSTSLMVTGDAADEAVTLARELPALSTGLHLVLCDGRAASPPGTVPDLADADGRLPATPLRAGLDDWLRRRRLRAQLEREIRAQLERYLASGLPLDHLDGHHHLHMHPVVFEILLRCLPEYRVPWLRLMDEDAVAREPGAPARAELVPAIFSWLARGHRRALARAGVGCADHVYGLRATGQMDAARLAWLLPRLRGDRVELFAHPGRDTEQGRREEEALCAPAVRAALETAGHRLAGTREIGHAHRGVAA